MAKNYYDEIIEKIELLINEQKNDQALKILNEELSISYVPREYEEKLIKLKNKIEPEKEQKRKSLFSREELLTIVNEYEKHDINFLVDICNGFEEYNWNGFEKELEKIFNLKNLDSKIKSVIYNNLVVQNMNYEFKIEKLDRKSVV